MAEKCIGLRAETHRDGSVFTYKRNHDDTFGNKPFISLNLSFHGIQVSFLVEHRNLILKDIYGQRLMIFGIAGAQDEKKVKLKLETREDGKVTLYVRNSSNDFRVEPFSPLELDFQGTPLILKVKGNQLIFYTVESELKKRLIELDIRSDE